MLLFGFVCAKMASISQMLLVLSTFFQFGVCVDPIVEITEPAIFSGVKIIRALKGADLDMVCVVQNKPTESHVMWMQQTGPFLKSLTTDTLSEEPDKYAIFNPTSISWRIRVQNIKEGDEGPYFCRVETQPKTYVKDSRFIQVVELPQIDSLRTSSDKVVNTGAELSLDCYASGRPAPVIIWTRLANADLPGGGKELRSSNLYLAKARPEHRGKYMCRAQNVAGEEIRVINVQIRFKPRVTSEKMAYQAVGYKKELFCEMESYPEIKTISWTGPGISDKDPNSEFTLSKGATNRVTTKLTIFKVTNENFGNYICTGNNGEKDGTGKFTITLAKSQEPVPDRTGVISGSARPGKIPLQTLLMVTCMWFLHIR